MIDDGRVDDDAPAAGYVAEACGKIQSNVPYVTSLASAFTAGSRSGGSKQSQRGLRQRDACRARRDRDHGRRTVHKQRVKVVLPTTGNEVPGFLRVCQRIPPWCVEFRSGALGTKNFLGGERLYARMHGGPSLRGSAPAPEPEACKADGNVGVQTPLQKAYCIKIKAACRAGAETSSDVVGSLQPGSQVVALEQTVNSAGDCRIRIASVGLDLEGWISHKPEILEELQGPAAGWAAVAAKLKLVDSSYGENDEGDYDYYSQFRLEYAGTQVWSISAHRGSNVSCAWGKQATAQLSPDCQTLLVRITDVKESLGGGVANTKGGEERLSVYDLLKGQGWLTPKELALLKDGQTGAGDSFEPTTRPVEKGSTWQLHSDPFAVHDA
jgi:hypothetical protein